MTAIPNTVYATPKGITEDYHRLREEGIKHLIDLGRDLWTDFNAHDPGITILEVLCYALMDLGYRTGFSVEDILAAKPGVGPDELKQFFTAAEILPSNPVTPLDFRKLLIDIPEVKNAWLNKGELPQDADNGKYAYQGLYEILLELHDERDPDNPLDTDEILAKVAATYYQHRNLGDDLSGIELIREKPLKIAGSIELSETADINAVKAAIIHRIQQFLNPPLRFYSLAEMRAKDLSYDQIYQGKVLQHGFLHDDELRNSRLRRLIFHSDVYQEILDVPGVSTVKSLGITLLRTEDQADATAPLGDPKYSDDWCLDICQKEQKVADTTSPNQGKYSATITCRHKPVLDETLEGSIELSFLKSELEITADDTEVREKLNLLRQLDRQPQMNFQLDKDYRQGNYRNIDQVFSIQDDFPLCYRVGEGEIISHISDEQKADVKNLKVYLSFFDQILANYLAHLCAVRATLAVEQDLHDAPQLFKDLRGLVSGFEHLLRPHYVLTGELLEDLRSHFNWAPERGVSLQQLVNLDPQPKLAFESAIRVVLLEEGFPQEEIEAVLRYLNQTAVAPDFYLEKLQTLATGNHQTFEQRNAILNHLLARFGEQFTDYSLFLYHLHESESCKEPPLLRKQHLLQCKVDFLRNIPQLGRDKGKAFNHKAPVCQNMEQFFVSGNVAGLQQRIHKLLCIPEPSEQVKTLADKGVKTIGRLSSVQAFAIKRKFDGDRKFFRFALVERGQDPADPDTTIYLLSEKRYGRRSKGVKDLKQLEDALLHSEELLPDQSTEKYLWISADGSRVVLKNNKGTVLALSPEEVDATPEDLRQKIIDLVYPPSGQVEGFHILEHLLLRPASPTMKEVQLDQFKVYPHEDLPTVDDPYSFWISIIVPVNWPRFPDENARSFFEQTVRREAPAHLGVRFIWVDNRMMYKFEDALLNWLYDEGRRQSDECQIEASLKELVTVMNELLALPGPN